MIGIRNKRLQAALGLVMLFLFAFGFQWSRGLWEPDEGRYTSVALQMLRGDNYQISMLDEEHPHFTKPPMTYWAIAASVALFGQSEWVVRVPNSLAFALTVLLMYRLGGVFLRERAWLPAIVYATMMLPYLAASVMTTDTLLTLWEVLAVTAFATAAFIAPEVKRRRWMVLMWLAFGLAFMTKGPPGLLPLVAILAFQLVHRPILWRQLLTPLGVVAFVVTGFSWYLSVALSYPELVDYFIHYEVVARVASGTHHRNSEWYGAFVIYLPTLLVGGLPWLVFPLSRLRLKYFRKPLNSYSALRPETRFLIFWVTIPLTVFFIARSRLPLYVLPVAAPLALLASLAVPADFFDRKRGVWLAGIMVVLLLGGRWYSGIYASKDDNRSLAREIGQYVTWPVEEVVFVDTPARYGLSFYLDAEIEHVCLLERCRGDSRFAWLSDEDLDAELDTLESSRLFVIDSDSYASFEATTLQRGIPVKRLGQVRGAVLASVEPNAGPATGR